MPLKSGIWFFETQFKLISMVLTEIDSG